MPPHIRPFSPTSDPPSLDLIFRHTAGPAFRHEPAATLGSHLFCHQYHELEPHTCLVLDSGDGSGRAVGYILATADTAAFAQRWRKATGAWDEASHPEVFRAGAGEEEASADLRNKLLHDPEAVLNLRAFPQLAASWPAHFHIDILPEFQRQGWGRRMVEAMLELLKARGVVGAHLGMEAGNGGAEKFYLAMGFRRWGEVLDGGKSGEVGRTGGENDVVFMVRDLK